MSRAGAKLHVLLAPSEGAFVRCTNSTAVMQLPCVPFSVLALVNTHHQGHLCLKVSNLSVEH